ncbi:hypothetical protein ASPWEDRAFT_182780 [Aspergillus wentii DTO 134E9]|uniref:Zn(2)-C6 fungal-type domain-containing protein n=1 Tax=Aspergillus wentii DTO 134E9 TaxID=1073089 RepID=A0A1L9RSV3_ASPWE|nr:uncharacterized protein ASPWEDRAFT_182780 [Aspergillus wentii DTO 134E9]OJJ37999.1 hypothetical protein ASPWEDRAFT_182780 [Aspergillus wentii DTO 134E9]
MSSSRWHQIPSISHPNGEKYAKALSAAGNASAARSDATSPACVSCQHRQLPCVSQQFVDDDSGYRKVGRRIDHVEALVGELIKQRSRSTAATINDGSISLPWQLSTGHSRSSYLYSILPRPHDAALLLSRAKFCNRPFQMFVSTSSTDSEALPPPTAHPVQFAR